MKKIIILISLALILVACDNSTCTNDNNTVCEIESIGEFELEADANVVVGVFNEAYGKSLVEAINEKHAGVYSYKVIDPNDISDLSGLDIVQMQVENVPLSFDKLRPLSEKFNTYFENEYVQRFSNNVNQSENYFMPLEVKGLLFAYNKTMLEALGVKLTDADDDGMPEAIDSFEKIGQLAETWKDKEVHYLDEPLQKVFSFPFNDQLSMLSFIENNNYHLIDGISGEDLQVKETLLEALNNFENLGQYPWHFDDESKREMKWDYEESLISQSAPFLLMGNWMFYEQYQQSQAYDLVFTKLPQINEADLFTLSTVSGFVLNKDSVYPMAQEEFIKFVKDVEGVELTISNGVIPVIDPLFLDVLEAEVSPNIKQQIKAYTYSKSTALQAFDKNPSIRAFDIYYDVDFRDLWNDLFFKEKSAEEVQTEMIKRIKVWLDEKNLKVEGINSELEEDNTKGEE